MLYFLFEEVQFLTPAQVLLLRNVLAAVAAFAAALVFGYWLVGFFRVRRVLENAENPDSERLSDLHRCKNETPTMGGFIFLVALFSATLFFARLDNRFVWTVLAAMVVLAAVGFLDDYVKLSFPGRKGITARLKLAVQLSLGLGLGAYLYWMPLHANPEVATGIWWPFGGFLSTESGYWTLGVLFIPFCALVVAGSSNGVNLTDGLDGLAMGCAVLVSLPLAVVAFLQSPDTVGVGLPAISGAGELSVVASAMVGAGLGFLWFNCHPARIFMGDTGALPLGGGLGILAVILKQEVLFLIVSGVFVLETLSVILQVGFFKLRRKRIFLCAPLHHHFQFKGWPETRVTMSFWIASALFATLSVLTFVI